MPLSQLNDYYLARIDNTINVAALNSDIQAYSRYAISQAGSPENSRVIMILKKVISNVSYGTPISITDAELAATADDLVSFNNWILNVIGGDPANSPSVKAIKTVLASVGYAPSASGGTTTPGGTQTPGGNVFTPGGTTFTPSTSFMDGPGKYVLFGGLGLAALWYFKLRKKAS